MKSVLTAKEKALFRIVNTPAKIQDFINAIPINFEKKKESLLSPRKVLEKNSAHCMEGALLAAAILWYHGHKPLLLDLKCDGYDFDHVVALFKQNGLWGAISKTNHAVLRYREPLYKSVRELALSYFHEYFDDNGTKTLRSFSAPFDLSKLGHYWIVSTEDVWEISDAIDRSPHFPFLPKGMKRILRKADPIEIQAGKLVQYKS